MNYNHLKIIILIAFSIGIKKIAAQTSSAIFISKSVDFRVTINKIKQHDKFTKNLHILRLTGELNYNISIDFLDDTTVIKDQIYLIDEGLTHIYDIDKKGVFLKKIIPLSVQTKKEKNQILIAYSENVVKAVSLISSIKDTVPIDSLSIQQFAHHYQLEGYDGKIGCPWPLKDENLAALKRDIQLKQLEDSKLEIAKEKIQAMDSICITIDQTIELLLLFQFEETKLELAKTFTPYFFDIDNIGKLEAAFDFENSMDELKKLLKK